jgi:hypothetical protein
MVIIAPPPPFLSLSLKEPLAQAIAIKYNLSPKCAIET